MLHYLKTAVEDIDNLIEATTKDIAQIKQANNEDVFSRITVKEELIKSFENKKALLDNELTKLVKNSPDKNLEELLSKEENTLLEDLKQKLSVLQKLNKDYAKLVIAVSEFYTSLMNKIFPQQENSSGYGSKKVAPASLLEVSV
jgi:uncharacterized protein YoxC